MPEADGRDEALLVPDTGLAIVTLGGADATAFLEAQSMTALAHLEPGRVRLCAFADARGRVLVTAYAWRSAGGWRLAVPRAEAQWTRAHLLRSRFRARVELDVPDLRLAGFLGTRAPAARGVCPAPGRVQEDAGGEVVALDAARRLLVGTRPQALAQADVETWKRARLYAGEPEVRAATRGAFLPQTLGLDALGALNLGKGCFPGQEIIARTEHLGRVKRRLALLRGEAAARPGETLVLHGVRVTVLDCARAPDAPVLVQAVAPVPLPAALAAVSVATAPAGADL